MKSKQEFAELVSGLGEEQSAYMHDFFRDCPDNVIAAMQYVRLVQGQVILRAGEPCEAVWVLLRGEVSGEDIQMPGNVYSFFAYSGIHIVGDYEPFAGLSETGKTVCAVTDCEALRIPAAVYMKWMRQDAHALFMRTQSFAQTLAQEISGERKYLLYNARERLLLYLAGAFDKQKDSSIRESGGECMLDMTQEQLAQHIGMSVRTVQRSIRRLMEEGFLTCRGGKIYLTQEQYRRLLECRDEKL